MALSSGFDLREALPLLHFCAITENGVTSPIPKDPPAGWTSVFVSPVIPPFDNLWQLWRRDADGAYAIAIRGTVYQAGSIAEDVLALMVKATGTFVVDGYSIPYSFAADPHAGVHLGFAVATLLIAELPLIGILDIMAANQIGPGTPVFITGHSQGAAMATLLRSYLAYSSRLPVGVDYKTYVYAQPKPGNDHYAADFERYFSNPGLGYRVTNSLDWVPQVPFTLEFLGDINVPNPLSVLTQPEMMIKVASALQLKTLEKMVDEFGHLIVEREVNRVRPALQQLATAKGHAAVLGKIDMPLKFSFNYVNAGTNFSLIGVPCSGSDCKDEFFEHHAAMYYGLLAPTGA